MKKQIIILLLYLLLFTIMFIVSLLNYIQHKPLVDIGIASNTLNLSIVLLSVGALAKTVFHLIHH